MKEMATNIFAYLMCSLMLVAFLYVFFASFISDTKDNGEIEYFEKDE